MINLQILENEKLPLRTIKAGELLMTQGTQTGLAYVLQYGKVEVLLNEQQLCTVSEPGALFGELAVILRSNHQATVKAMSDSTFYVIKDFEALASKYPEIAWSVTELLAKRLIATNEILTMARKRFEELLHESRNDTAAEKKLKSGVRAAWEQFGELMRSRIADF